MTRNAMVALAGAAVMAISGTALGGGWATTTIDDAPEQFRAGTTHEITYTVLQHGRTRGRNCDRVPTGQGDNVFCVGDRVQRLPDR
jgi:hypothetical protein